MKVNAGILYKLDFPSGKLYIGITTMTLESRLRGHRHDAKRNEKTRPLIRAWNKYGEPIATILAIVERRMLKETERRAIRVLGCASPHGYNLSPGGDGGPLPLETRAKIAASLRGKVRLTAEHKAKLLAVNLGRKMSRDAVDKSLAARRGIKHTEEAKRKVADARRGSIASEVTKQKMSTSARAAWARRKAS